MPYEGPEVELILHGSRSHLSGTGRYMRELYSHLKESVQVRWASTIDPPLARYLVSLQGFPLSVEGHHDGSIIHFTQPQGSMLMLWNPIRPAVATVHDLSWLVWPSEARMFRKLEKLILYSSYMCLKRMDAIITVSEYTRRTVIDRLGIPEERVFAIHSGNRGDQFRPITNASARLAEKYTFLQTGKYKYLLYVGNEFPRKNLATLLKALSLLPSDVRLLKVGGAGGQRFRAHTLRLITKMGLEERVIFFPEVTDEDLALLYNSADLYVCSSFLEGFCHPILEAMACGLPVVCSNRASLPEIAGDAALLIPPEEAEAFAQAILLVLNDTGCRERMAAGGLKHAGSFSWGQTAKRMAEIYSLVANHRFRRS
jgi:alpha-1,3-rhamnosyl/mannosyltransferase